MKQYIIPATVAALAAFSYAQEAAPTAPAPQVPQSGVVVKGERVFINGHELPPDVAAELIRSGAISELAAPIDPIGLDTVSDPAATPAPKPEPKPAPAPAPKPEATAPTCTCAPVCKCEPSPGKPGCCDKTAPAPAPAPAATPAIKSQVRIFINGQEITAKPYCATPCNCGPAPKPCTCTPEQKCGPTTAAPTPPPLTRSCSNGNSGVHLLPRLQV